MGIYNCIFQMENSMALDFGPDLAATLALDDTIRSSDILVYGGGTRVWRSSPQDPWDNAQSNTESAAPFLGPINYSSNNPAQFFLDPGPPTDPDFDNNTFPGLGTSGIDGLVEIDFSGSNRPVVLSERDKGAEELP